MANMIIKKTLNEGDYLNSWFYDRIKRNKNIILAFTGATGSGKSYSCLRVGENWYKYKFNDEFPVENVCFSIGDLMMRINQLHKSSKLRKGELFILEEAGANFSNLEFQNKISKMFGFVLQSFRSMNLILLMNLPVLSMLNKTARLLIHGHFTTTGIDTVRNYCIIKPLHHQLNQQSGKSYWKYPRIFLDTGVVTIKSLNFALPSDRVIKEYEEKKENFVMGGVNNLIEKTIEEFTRNKNKQRIPLTANEKAIVDRLYKGYSTKQLAVAFNCSESNINRYMINIKKKGFDISQFIMAGKKSNEMYETPPITT